MMAQAAGVAGVGNPDADLLFGAGAAAGAAGHVAQVCAGAAGGLGAPAAQGGLGLQPAGGPAVWQQPPWLQHQQFQVNPFYQGAAFQQHQQQQQQLAPLQWAPQAG